MRKISATLLVSALAIGSAAFAATAPSSTAPKPSSSPSAAKPAAHAMWASGEVTAVDAAAKTLKVKGGTGEMTFTTSDQTAITLGATAGKWDDLKVGAKVKVMYTSEGGKMVAGKIIVQKH